MPLSPYRSRKPSLGTPVDRDHPWWPHVDLYLPFLEGVGATPMEYARQAPVQMVGTAAPTWVPGPNGGAAPNLSTASGWSVPGAGRYTSQPWTASFWLDQDSGAQATTLFGTGSYGGSGWTLITNDNANGAVYLAYNNSSGAYRTDTPTGLIIPGTWQHWVITTDGGTVWFYRNGVLVYFWYTYGISAAATTVPLAINSTLYYGSPGAVGLDNVLFLNGKALSSIEVNDLYRRPWQLFTTRPSLFGVPAIVPGLSAAGPIYANGSQQSVALTGFDRAWSGSPFSITGTPPAGVRIASQSLADADHATVQLATGIETGPVSITDGTVTTTVQVVAPSFVIAPATVPASHPGHITLTLTGSGTNWASGTTTFALSGTIPTGAAIVSQTIVSPTSATVVISTGSGTGPLTLSDGTRQAAVTIAAPSLAATIATTPVVASGTYTVALHDPNAAWTQETASTLFSASGWTGASVANIVVTDDQHATATLSFGTQTLGGGTVSILDNSTGSSAPITVAGIPSGSLHATAKAVLECVDNGSLFGNKTTAGLSFEFEVLSVPAVPHDPVTVLGFASQYSPIATWYPATGQLQFGFYSSTLVYGYPDGFYPGTGPGNLAIAVQPGARYVVTLSWGPSLQFVSVNGVPLGTRGFSGHSTWGYSGPQIGPSTGDAGQLDCRISNLAIWSNYAPTVADAEALAAGTATPLTVGGGATAWWPMGGGTPGANPTLADSWLSDWTGNGHALTLASGALTATAYDAAIPATDPFLRSDWIAKSGKLAVFGLTSSTPNPGASPVPAAITAVNAAPTVYRNGHAVTLGAPTWFSGRLDTPVVAYLLQCGAVEQLAIKDGGEEYTSPVVSWATGSGGGSSLTLGTPVLATGVTGYTITGAGTGCTYCNITVGPPPGYKVSPTSPQVAQAVATVSGGSVTAVVPAAGGLPGCGSGYSATSPPVLTISTDGTGVAITPVVSAYIAYVSVVSSSDDFTGPPSFTITDSGGTPTRAAVFQPLMTGNPTVLATGTTTAGSPVVTGLTTTTGMAVGWTTHGDSLPSGATITSVDSSSQVTLSVPATTSDTTALLSAAAPDVWTYDAPAGWLSGSFIGVPLGGLPAVTGQPFVNSAGRMEAPAGGLPGFDATPTMLAGGNWGEQPVSPYNACSPFRNKAYSGKWVVQSGGGAITLNADGSGRPSSWTLPGSTLLKKWCYGTGDNDNQVDSMGGPTAVGPWMLIYDDPHVNTAQATWLQITATNAVNAYVSQSGPNTGQTTSATVAAADIVLSGGTIQSVGVANSSLGTGYQGAFVLVSGGGGSNAILTANVSGGLITGFNVVWPGSGYTSTPTITVYGTAVSGSTVTMVVDVSYPASPTSWELDVTLFLVNGSGQWTIGSPIVLPPDPVTGQPMTYNASLPFQMGADALATLTTPSGRTPGAVRFMDVLLGYAGNTNLTYPTDLFDPTADNWQVPLGFQSFFTQARFFNTDPNDSTYAWSSPKIYAPQGFFTETDPPFTITGTLTAGSNTITSVSSPALMCGSTITGTGIPTGPNGEPNRITQLLSGGASIRIAYAATATGSQSLSVTNPAYMTLPATDHGRFMAPGTGVAAWELVSTVPHGITTGQSAFTWADSGAAPLPIAGYGPYAFSNLFMCHWVTGPYTTVVFIGLNASPTSWPAGIESTAPIDLTAGGKCRGWGADVVWPMPAGYGTAGACLPYEAAAQLVAQLPGCAFWLNLPQCATAELSAEIARRVAANLGSTNPVYLEYTNEIWNTNNTKQTFGRGLGNLIGYLPTGTTALDGYTTTGEGVPDSGSYNGASALIGDHLHTAFETAWTAAGQDPGRIHRVHGANWGDAGSTTIFILEALARAGATPGHIAIAPYHDLPADPPIVQAFSPAGAATGAGSWPVDAINDMVRYWAAYSTSSATSAGNQRAWQQHAQPCQNFGQPMRQQAVLTSNAAVSAVLTPTSIQSITLSAGGGGYSGSTTATLYGGGGPVTTLTPTFSGGSITSLSLPSGSNWTSPPSVSITDPTGAGSGAFATASLAPTSVASLTIGYGGVGYGQSGASAVQVTIAGPQTSGTTAQAGTVSISGSALTGVLLQSGGSGYNAPPSVSVTGGGVLPAGNYNLKCTFLDAQGHETTTGLASTAFSLGSSAGPPRMESPSLPAWAAGANFYLTDGQPGSETFYTSITRAQWESSGPWLPLDLPLPSPSGRRPPLVNQVPSATIGELPTLVTYEGGLQTVVPEGIPLRYPISHDTAAHPSFRDAIWGWYAACQLGCQWMPSGGAVLANYYQFYFQAVYNTGGWWDLAPGTHCQPGAGLSNRFATVQGGGTAAAPPDMHDHTGGPSANEFPALQGLRDWVEISSPRPVQPTTSTPRRRRWFSGLGQPAARLAR